MPCKYQWLHQIAFLIKKIQTEVFFPLKYELYKSYYMSHKSHIWFSETTQYISKVSIKCSIKKKDFISYVRLYRDKLQNDYLFFKVVMNLCQKTYLLTNNLTICLIIMEINICKVRFALVCLYCLSILLLFCLRFTWFDLYSTGSTYLLRQQWLTSKVSCISFVTAHDIISVYC